MFACKSSNKVKQCLFILFYKPQNIGKKKPPEGGLLSDMLYKKNYREDVYAAMFSMSASDRPAAIGAIIEVIGPTCSPFL